LITGYAEVIPASPGRNITSGFVLADDTPGTLPHSATPLPDSDTMRASLKVEASNLHRKDNRCAMLQALAARLLGLFFFFRAPTAWSQKGDHG